MYYRRHDNIKICIDKILYRGNVYIHTHDEHFPNTYIIICIPTYGEVKKNTKNKNGIIKLLPFIYILIY